MAVISGPKELTAFRNYWDGKRMLDLLHQYKGRLRVDWAVGVGKSFNIDSVIEEAVVSKQYDLVIALFPTRRIIEEREWVINPPVGVKLVNLKPRPGKSCGGDMNKTWQLYEKNGLGVLGRIELCAHCLLQSECHWPKHFGKSMEGTQVVFGAQAHFERSPYFLDQLARWSKAERILVILDEANFIMKPFRRRVERDKLAMFVDVLKMINPRRGRNIHKKWKYLCELLLTAPTSDLRSSDWKMPWISHSWSLTVQSRGYNIFGDLFFFLAFELFHFGCSPLESRERTTGGDIVFAAVPNSICRRAKRFHGLHHLQRHRPSAVF